MNELVDKLQRAESQSQAEQAVDGLESAYYLNGALQPGCDELAERVFRGLDAATSAGVTESWGMLGDLAAAAAQDGPAATDLIADVRAAYIRNASRAVERLNSTRPEPYDLLALDVVDCLLDFAPAGLTDVLMSAVRAFRRRDRANARPPMWFSGPAPRTFWYDGGPPAM